MAQIKQFIRDPNRKTRLNDGGGLALVYTTKSKSFSWVYRYSFRQKQRSMGLRNIEPADLAKARNARDAELILLGQNLDPLDLPVEDDVKVPTFKEAAKHYIDLFGPHWKNKKHLQQWQNTLDTYAEPIADMQVDRITADHITICLKPIWYEKQETARRVRQRIFRVLESCRSRSFIPGTQVNPASPEIIGSLLPMKRKAGNQKHFAAVDWKSAPTVYKELCKQPGMAALATRMVFLCAARPGEIVNLSFDDLDLDHKMYVLGAGDTKTSITHRVPLSDEAIRVVERAIALGGRNKERSAGRRLAFPSSHTLLLGENRPMSGTGLVKQLRKACVDADATDLRATVHGLRSTFKDWSCAGTVNGGGEYDFHLSERALGHQLGKVQRAYARDDQLEARRVMMQDWANFLVG